MARGEVDTTIIVPPHNNLGRCGELLGTILTEPAHWSEAENPSTSAEDKQAGPGCRCRKGTHARARERTVDYPVGPMWKQKHARRITSIDRQMGPGVQ